MTNSIDIARVQEYFKNNFIMLAQQKDSRTDRAVGQVKTVNGKQAFFDRIGLTDGQLKASRHESSLILDVPHTRRMVSLDTWVWGEMIDKSDLLRISGDPTNAYIEAAVAFFKRKKDRLFIDAALGNAYGGETGGTTVALPAGQQIAHGSAALTLTKLKQAQKILRAADVDLDNEEMFLFVDSEGLEDLQGITEFINADYNSSRPLADGVIKNFMGMNIIHSQRLADATVSTNRSALLVVGNAMCKAVGEEIRIEMGPNPDKQFNIQLHMESTIGYTRLVDEKVVDIRFQV